MDGSRRAGFSAKATVNRKDWGLDWNVALEAGGWLVGDKVKLEVDVAVQEVMAIAAAAGTWRPEIGSPPVESRSGVRVAFDVDGRAPSASRSLRVRWSDPRR